MIIRPTRIATIAVALAGFGLSACGPQVDTFSDQSDTFELSKTEMIESGRDIVESQCVSCHAIALDDQSQRSDAPPLRTVLANYDPDALAEDFREQVHIGHPDMPDFEFGPIGTDHVLAYLISIQEPQVATE